MLPRVTIIIANYNYDRYISESIQSAIDQDYEGPLTVCVIDDGSTDSSWEKIQSLFLDEECEYIDDMKVISGYVERNKQERVKLIGIKTRNGGASVARNTGIDFCIEDTDVYAILDSDDIYYSNKITRCIDKIIEDDRIGAVYADYSILNVDTGATRHECKFPYSKKVLERHCIVHSGALITKSALLHVKEDGYYYAPSLHGPAGEDFIGCAEDYDLWIRISEQFMMVHVPVELALAREGAHNQTANVTSEIHSKNLERIYSKKQARLNVGSSQ